jgi:hypothetical protein
MSDAKVFPGALDFIRQRIDQLEADRGMVAADISSLRTEMRTRFEALEKHIDRSFDRLEELISDRPSRAELVGMPSKSPSVELRGPFGFFAQLRRIDGGVLVVFFVLVAIVVALFLLTSCHSPKSAEDETCAFIARELQYLPRGAVRDGAILAKAACDVEEAFEGNTKDGGK